MSNTYKTNKARTARKLGKTLNKELNAILRGDVAGINDGSHYNEYQKEIQDLQVESHRYGNQRHAQAQIKVIRRRAERASNKVATRKRIGDDM
jgi:hypothetical protein